MAVKPGKRLMHTLQDTIAAIATPPGRGGVGIVRVSGAKASYIASEILGFVPKVRMATYTPFLEASKQIDQGIAIFFQAPHSFTGEDVLELQGHGGPVVLDLLLRRVIGLGARIANPGEFSERAFLNDKIDLLQAEAIADLIDASSEQAALGAMRSLQGDFSNKINELVELLIQLRIYVEAAIDFPEEEIDFLSDGKVLREIDLLLESISQVLQSASQGALLREGIKVVLAGKPNAGKSSLLNALSGSDRAIVTDIEGTTRDILSEHIQIDGMPLHIIDTAGLRESNDPIEKLGIERARKEIEFADLILLLVDSSRNEHIDADSYLKEFFNSLKDRNKVVFVRNKIDLTGELPGVREKDGWHVSCLSAKNGTGLRELKDHLKQQVGFKSTTEGHFIARRRHLESIRLAHHHIQEAKAQLLASQAGEIVAEELRVAQQALESVTGAFSSDDLLGRIFSSFCIGK